LADEPQEGVEMEAEVEAVAGGAAAPAALADEPQEGVEMEAEEVAVAEERAVEAEEVAVAEERAVEAEEVAVAEERPKKMAKVVIMYDEAATEMKRRERERRFYEKLGMEGHDDLLRFSWTYCKRW